MYSLWLRCCFSFLLPMTVMKCHSKSNPVNYLFWQFSGHCKEKITTLWYHPFSIAWFWSKCSNSERMSCCQCSVLFKNSFFGFSKMHLFSYNRGKCVFILNLNLKLKLWDISQNCMAMNIELIYLLCICEKMAKWKHCYRIIQKTPYISVHFLATISILWRITKLMITVMGRKRVVVWKQFLIGSFSHKR
jgi:hypothetical protein